MNIDDIAAGAKAAAQSPPQVEPQPAMIGPGAPGAKLGLRQPHLRDDLRDFGDLSRAHLGKVSRLQHLAVGDGEPDLPLLRHLALARDRRLRQRLVNAPRGRRRWLLSLNRQRDRIQHALPFLGSAKEQIEDLGKDQRMIAARHENRSERCEDVRTLSDLDQAQGVQRVDHRARPDRKASSAQHARKADDIVCDLSGRRIEMIDSHTLYPGCHSGARG